MKSLVTFIKEGIVVKRSTDSQVISKCNSKYDNPNSPQAKTLTQQYDKEHANGEAKSSVELVGAVPKKDFQYYKDEDTYNVNMKSSNKDRIQTDLKNQGYKLIGKDQNGNTIWRK